jgi:pilus assembly protein CpaB
MTFPVRTMMFGGAAIFIAFIVYLSAQRVLAAQPEAAAPEPAPQTIEIMVALRDLPAGTTVAPTDIAWKAWPVESVLPAYARKGGPEAAGIMGNRLIQDLHAGEPVRSGAWQEAAGGGTLALITSPDMRAVSLPLSATSGVSGLVTPGDRVDVILTHALPRAPDEQYEQKAAVTILHDRLVLAVEQRMAVAPQSPIVTDAAAAPSSAAKETGPLEPRTASLEVTPKEAEHLALAAQLGSLSLALRPFRPGDHASAATSREPTVAAELSRLLAYRRQRPAPSYAPPASVPTAASAAPVRRPHVAIYRGGQGPSTGAQQ